MQLNTLLTNAKLTMALNQSPFHHTVSLFTKMKGKLGHRVRDPPAVKQIIKWQFALKQFAISSLFFCTLLTLHKQERDTNLQRGEVLQVRLQSWWFVCVPWCKASSKLRLVDAVPACCPCLLSLPDSALWKPQLRPCLCSPPRALVGLDASYVYSMLRLGTPRKFVASIDKIESCDLGYNA